MSDLTVGAYISGLFPQGLILEEHRSSIERAQKKLGLEANFDSTQTKLQRRFERSAESGPRRKYITPPATPFDLFAIAVGLLRKSGAHHHIESYSGNVQETVRLIYIDHAARSECERIAARWAESGGARTFVAKNDNMTKGIPEELCSFWIELVTNHWSERVFDHLSRDSEPPDWWILAHRLMIIADCAAKGCGLAESSFVWPTVVDDTIEQLMKDKKTLHSLALADRDQASVLPKTRTAQMGCTLRSLSHHLALLPERGRIRATWHRQYQNRGPGDVTDDPRNRRTFNAVIVPYPYSILSRDFEPARQTDSDSSRFRFLPKAPFPSLEDGKKTSATNGDGWAQEFVSRLYNSAKEQVSNVDAIIFPELALNAREFFLLASWARSHTGVELLCGGIRQRLAHKNLSDVINDGHDLALLPPANQAVMISFERTSAQDRPREHTICAYEKHHRWRLNGRQIVEYGLSSSLDPARDWWEDTHILSRELPFVVMRDRWLATTLICEDLARVDPAQEVVRAIGPNLVIALLMDGPQIKERWPSRYATILADDPGCAVLTVNSLGLIRRSAAVRQQLSGKRSSRAVALWRDDTGEAHELELPEDAQALCVSIAEHRVDEHTLDMRSCSDRIALRLANYFPITLTN